MLLTTIKDFALANALYAGASVALYETDAAFHITATLATLYENPQGTGQPLANPQTLDSFGKFVQPVYIASPVIAVVNGLTFPTLTTGVIYTVPSFRVDQATSKLQYSYDGGVNWVDTGGWIFRSRGAWAAGQYNLLDLVTSGGAINICVVAHVAVGAFDPTKFITLFSLDQGTLPGGQAFQLRRGTTLQIDAMTPANGEPIYDTTKDTLVVGDGVLVGGFPVVSEMSYQKNALISAVAGGTGNAMTATIQSKLVALVNFMRISVLAPGANSISAPSMNLTLQTAAGANTATGAIGISKGNNNALANGDVAGANHVIELEYYNGTWRLLNPAGQVDANLDPSFLTALLYPSRDGWWRDVFRSGFMPWGFNQGWGGAQIGHEFYSGNDGALYKFDTATGYVEDDASATSFGNVAGATYAFEGFTVSESQSISAIWIKIYKNNNPATNLTLRILPDDGTGTKPTLNVPIANGTATAQSGKLHTSKTTGEWHRFVFPVPCALVAGTRYHIVASSSGAVDATNYWNWKMKQNGIHYPFGNRGVGDATPTWTATATAAHMFMIENATANSFLQTGGIFDSKLTFMQGTPINQSKALVRPLNEFFDGKTGSILIRGGTWTQDRTIADFMYGLDHDRMVLRSNVGTGFGQIDLYRSDGTKTTITAVATDLSAGNHDIGITYRMVGDGADYVRLYVDGALAAQATAQTFTMDGNFRELGTLTIGGGFNVAPAFTLTLDMTTLPSAAGWTWTGAATEANAFSVQGGKGYQNRSGYTALQDGYYLRNAMGLSNANGWCVEVKERTPASANTISAGDVNIVIEDGTKVFGLLLKENYVQFYGAASLGTVQVDNKTAESVYLIFGKLTDVYVVRNGRLIFDGTGLLATATANNRVSFGDLATSSGDNADAVWDYLKVYNTAITLPQFSSGSLSELAAWSGDKSGLFMPLYNGGAPIAVKQYAGVETNYVGAPVVQKQEQLGLSRDISTPSASYVLLTELESFVVGGEITARGEVSVFNSVAANNSVHVVMVDAAYKDQDPALGTPTNASNLVVTNASPNKRRYPVGLHRVHLAWATTGGTIVNNNSGGGGRKLVTETTS